MNKFKYSSGLYFAGLLVNMIVYAVLFGIIISDPTLHFWRAFIITIIPFTIVTYALSHALDQIRVNIND